jgi:hypothetical protein
MTTDVTAERQHAEEAAMVLAGMGLPLNGIQWGGALALPVTMAALAGRRDGGLHPPRCRGVTPLEGHRVGGCVPR